MVLAFCLGVNRLEGARSTQGRQQLEDALRRTAVSCYASQGFYPPSVDYMVRHWGLRYDPEQFTIHYEVFASNLMPDITVLDNAYGR